MSYAVQGGYTLGAGICAPCVGYGATEEDLFPACGGQAHVIKLLQGAGYPLADDANIGEVLMAIASWAEKNKLPATTTPAEACDLLTADSKKGRNKKLLIGAGIATVGLGLGYLLWRRG